MTTPNEKRHLPHEDALEEEEYHKNSTSNSQEEPAANDGSGSSTTGGSQTSAAEIGGARSMIMSIRAWAKGAGKAVRTGAKAAKRGASAAGKTGASAATKGSMQSSGKSLLTSLPKKAMAKLKGSAKATAKAGGKAAKVTAKTGGKVAAKATGKVAKATTSTTRASGTAAAKSAAKTTATSAKTATTTIASKVKGAHLRDSVLELTKKVGEESGDHHHHHTGNSSGGGKMEASREQMSTEPKENKPATKANPPVEGATAHPVGETGHPSHAPTAATTVGVSLLERPIVSLGVSCISGTLMFAMFDHYLESCKEEAEERHHHNHQQVSSSSPPPLYFSDLPLSCYFSAGVAAGVVQGGIMGVFNAVKGQPLAHVAHHSGTELIGCAVLFGMFEASKRFFDTVMVTQFHDSTSMLQRMASGVNVFLPGYHSLNGVPTFPVSKDTNEIDTQMQWGPSLLRTGVAAAAGVAAGCCTTFVEQVSHEGGPREWFRRCRTPQHRFGLPGGLASRLYGLRSGWIINGLGFGLMEWSLQADDGKSLLVYR